MSSIQSYTISVPEEKIERLKAKLALFDLPDELPDAEPWARGPPLSEIKRLANYWANGYNWRKAEAQLNEFPNFITRVQVEGFDTYDVHFIHQKSTVKNAIPLLFSHGWPGSFIEATKILPLLVDGGKDYPAFDVVAPSLVDFGFSSSSLMSGFTVEQHAEVCHKLMLRLGYEQYVVQGGDLGYAVSRLLAMKYPESVKGQLINLAVPSEPTITSHPALFQQVQSTPLTEWEMAGIARTEWFSVEGAGYNKLQQTKPQTLAYAMAANPVGLLAWIYDKLHDWADEYPWTDDELLTWVSIYEFSTAGSWANQRIYYEDAHAATGPSFAQAASYIDVKLGISRFPKELLLRPRLWHHTMGPVVLMNEHDKGGHFAAWEVPELLVRDIREMFGRDGGAFGVVEGRSGYEQ
ncbi:microsomal epoxide hydrolase [Exophiala aquamarina CBS 119918]|uniref:Microsomal epoxide hydrolase n=1 Tax=Exophiala aquamarina CBS 119918 TaxID=1182545 RepID=A0A072PM86_9EURO|nr:microsomal epoxide hydrolase [Exophiala aquamarina CBS 119918]KEF60837.1 microsomal epoxide hydrolase [Exophiala aquamarina CBS 119918]